MRFNLSKPPTVNVAIKWRILQKGSHISWSARLAIWCHLNWVFYPFGLHQWKTSEDNAKVATITNSPPVSLPRTFQRSQGKTDIRYAPTRLLLATFGKYIFDIIDDFFEGQKTVDSTNLPKFVAQQVIYSQQILWTRGSTHISTSVKDVEHIIVITKKCKELSWALLYRKFKENGLLWFIKVNIKLDYASQPFFLRTTKRYLQENSSTVFMASYLENHYDNCLWHGHKRATQQ